LRVRGAAAHTQIPFEIFMAPNNIYLALGTNLGRRLSNLRSALSALPPLVTLLERSPVYETPPWGVTSQPAFLNMVILGETALPPQELLGYLKDLETRLGRKPSFRYGPRKIDLDILFYGDTILNTLGLTLPHPRLHERAFVLVPLADLAPEMLHPVLGKTIRQLLAGVDVSGVKRYGKDC
jgi:2-amino-4-hydroxy-6-hydroxymethyldihydropteridine diphosphokinase